jgi:hypothetical protein
MKSFSAAFPILLGKDQACKEFAETCMGPRRNECLDSLKRMGIPKETWHLQKTPMGSFIVVHFGYEDLAKAFQVLAESGHPFDLWVRQHILQITGYNYSKPAREPPPEEILNMST